MSDPVCSECGCKVAVEEDCDPAQLLCECCYEEFYRMGVLLEEDEEEV